MPINIKNDSEACQQHHMNFTYASPPEHYCNATADGYFCWPPSPPNQTIYLRCPAENGIDITKFAYRICQEDGHWKMEENNPKGYTYFEQCFTPETKVLFELVKAMGHDTVINIVHGTRLCEMVGLTASLVSLIISLFIFCYYRSLRNNRTRIHMNLIVAMVIQVQVRLIIYIDQTMEQSKRHIDKTPYICEGAYVLLEYGRTAMFMWMFVEGLYLHNVITVTVFQEYSYFVVYFLIGWGLPALMTTAWVVTISLATVNTGCWYAYNLQPYFWILEGPRMAVIMLNMLFLLNIIRVLVVKVRQSHASEIEQVRKAVRAAVFLLPLMGITNLLCMIDMRQFRTGWKFGVWSYTTAFLSCFQGLIIAVLYCFLNGEVRMAVKNSFSVYMSLRSNRYQTRRNSTFMSTVTENDS